MSSQASVTTAHEIRFWFQLMQGEVAQFGVFRDADAVLGAGPAAMA